MDAYDPQAQPPAGEWLALDEAQRLALVEDYHRRSRVRLPNVALHAAIHVVVENQLALGEQVVISTLARLESEGLDRHEAVHAIGSVLTEYLYELMHERSKVTDDAYVQYLERLRDLTAAAWRAN